MAQVVVLPEMLSVPLTDMGECLGIAPDPTVPHTHEVQTISMTDGVKLIIKPAMPYNYSPSPRRINSFFQGDGRAAFISTANVDVLFYGFSNFLAFLSEYDDKIITVQPSKEYLKIVFMDNAHAFGFDAAIAKIRSRYTASTEFMSKLETTALKYHLADGHVIVHTNTEEDRMALSLIV